VKVVFDINEGPKVKVRDIEFIGNDKISDGKLREEKMKEREQWASRGSPAAAPAGSEVRRGRRQAAAVLPR
jgi:outer membrane protein assembly factor BamA